MTDEEEIAQLEGQLRLLGRALPTHVCRCHACEEIGAYKRAMRETIEYVVQMDQLTRTKHD